MADSSKRPSLTVLGGPMASTTLVLDEAVDDVLIGSDPACRLCLPLPGVSPVHARLWIDESGVTIYDTHSPRGLYVNDEPVKDHLPLRNADILWLGVPGEEDAVMIQCRFPSLEKTRPLKVPEWTAAEDATPEAAPTQEMEGVAQAPQAEAEPEAPASPESISEEEFVSGSQEGIEGPSSAAEPSAEAAGSPDETFLVAGRRVPLAPSGPPGPQSFEDETDATVIASASAAPPPPAPWVAPPVAPLPPAYAPPPPAATVIVPAQPEAAAAPPPVFRPPAPPPPAPAPLARPVARAPAEPVRPQPRPAEPAPPAQVSQRAPARRRSSAVYVAIPALLVVLGGGAYMAFRLLPSGGPASSPPPVQPGSPASTLPPAMPAAPVPTPAAVADKAAAPEQIVPTEEEVTIVPTAPSPRAVPSPPPASPPPRRSATAAPPPAPEQKAAEAPRAQPVASQVASLLAQAESAASSGSLDAAIAAYDEILRLDPGNQKAAQGRQNALTARESARRSFVAGRTAVQTEKVAKGGLAGFDSSDVSVQKAPDFLGRIEFAVSPPKVKAGEGYSLKIYLVNEGKKAIKVSGLTVITVVNGSPSGGPVTARAREVAPQQRALLEELPGVWPEGVTTWTAEVAVTAQKGDSLKNRLTWK